MNALQSAIQSANCLRLANPAEATRGLKAGGLVHVEPPEAYSETFWEVLEGDGERPEVPWRGSWEVLGASWSIAWGGRGSRGSLGEVLAGSWEVPGESGECPGGVPEGSWGGSWGSQEGSLRLLTRQRGSWEL